MGASGTEVKLDALRGDKRSRDTHQEERQQLLQVLCQGLAQQNRGGGGSGRIPTGSLSRCRGGNLRWRHAEQGVRCGEDITQKSDACQKDNDPQ